MAGSSAPYIPPPTDPVHGPVTPWMPPPQAPQQGGQQGGSYNVGYGGTNGGVGTPVGPPLPPRFPWDAFYQAQGRSDQAANAGLGALQWSPMSSPFGQQLGSMFSTPYGLPPELLAQQRRMLAETEAGSRANALDRSERSATASGFGNSMGANRAQDMIRTESASNLNNAMNKLAIEDALLGMQRQMSAGGLLGNLFGLEGQMRQSYASGQFGRQFPIAPYGQGGPGGQGGQGGPTSPWYNQQGQYQSGPMPYDPFTGGKGGYSPQQPYSPW